MIFDRLYTIHKLKLKASLPFLSALLPDKTEDTLRFPKAFTKAVKRA